MANKDTKDAEAADAGGAAENRGAGPGLLSDRALSGEPERGEPNEGNWRKIRHVRFEYYEEERDPLNKDRVRLRRRLARYGDVVQIPREEDLELGERHHAFFRDAELALEHARAEAVPVQDKTDQQLIDWISGEHPSAETTVAAAQGDPRLAQRILDAETAATAGEPRDDVLHGLATVIQSAD